MNGMDLLENKNEYIKNDAITMSIKITRETFSLRDVPLLESSCSFEETGEGAVETLASPCF